LGIWFEPKKVPLNPPVDWPAVVLNKPKIVSFILLRVIRVLFDRVVTVVLRTVEDVRFAVVLIVEDVRVSVVVTDSNAVVVFEIVSPINFAEK
jgi:hypothetical protein